jgi:hypothetical protein
VKASNSCVRILIFNSFFFIAFLSSFFTHFRFFNLAFYCLFSYFILFFIAHCFPLLFALVLSLFFITHVVSSLDYLNLLRNKRLCCYCCSKLPRNLVSFFTIQLLQSSRSMQMSLRGEGNGMEFT